MKKTSKTIIFFGNERLATSVSTTAPTLQALIDNGYDVAAVISNHTEARSRSTRNLEIAEVATGHDIPVWLPNKPSEVADKIKATGAEVGILVAYGRIVPQSVIDLFPRGILNIHPSLLPLHRGPTPIESVILNGDTKTGVSIMQLAAAMDAGPVYKQSSIDLDGGETKQQLADKLLGLGRSMLLEVLPEVLNGQLKPSAQDNSQATYDQLITKSDGQLDWSKPALELERQIRAYKDWPQSRSRLAGKEVVITAAHVVPTNAGGKPGDLEVLASEGIIMVQCGSDALCLDRVKPAGKAEMSVADFINGHKSQLLD